MKKLSRNQFNTNVNRFVKAYNATHSDKISKTKAREVFAREYGYNNYNHFLKLSSQRETALTSEQLLEIRVKNLKLLSDSRYGVARFPYFEQLIEKAGSLVEMRKLELELGLQEGHLDLAHNSRDDIFKARNHLVRRVSAGLNTWSINDADDYAYGIRSGVKHSHIMQNKLGSFLIGKSNKSDVSVSDPILVWKKGAFQSTALICYLLNEKMAVDVDDAYCKSLIDITQPDITYRKLFMVRTSYTDTDGQKMYMVDDWTCLNMPNSTPAHATYDLNGIDRPVMTTRVLNQYNKPEKQKATNRTDPYLEAQLEEARKIMGSGYDRSEVERYLEHTDDVALACYWAIKY